MKAYDLLFGDDPAHLAIRPGGKPEIAAPGAVAAGWTGARAPSIRPEHWPLSPTTGIPMAHAISLWLPPEYRRRGPDLVGISFWAGEGQLAHYWTWEPLHTTTDPHPNLEVLTDAIDGKFALMWLTAAELTGPPALPPPDTRTPIQMQAEDEGCKAWDPDPVVRVWTAVREWDVNAGIAPEDPLAPGYDAPRTRYLDWFDGPKEFSDVARQYSNRTHLGGTAFPVQAMPGGLTPYYLELQEIGNPNFGGGGCAQIDLESGVFDWACG